ncbi:ATP-binding protein [Janthinobacterium sp. JC611]|uniref:AAA family ATPase n=1 Tax=Janthinobacterium sp. JC611 TaxID=2816201 RepID=UPI001BFEC540|nr:ATP-binding protein [Janthinobacterium sp. JC611]
MSNLANPNVFELKTSLPTQELQIQEQKLLGFDERYTRVQKRLQLMMQTSELERWSQTHHRKQLAVIGLLNDQYPLAIFYGDVGTGKTANAEAIANRLAREARIEDAILFKLSNKVRGTGKVGEMGTLIAQAFEDIGRAIGRGKGRAFLIIDEGDSLGASRSQEHSHHEDKVGVNTLIQAIDGLRKQGGRIFAILCTNRLDALDAAVIRRASIVEEFKRPSEAERLDLFKKDLADLSLPSLDLDKLVKATAAVGAKPSWTYSDIRTRLYPAAVAKAFPDSPLKFEHFLEAANEMAPSPVMHG